MIDHVILHTEDEKLYEVRLRHGVGISGPCTLLPRACDPHLDATMNRFSQSKHLPQLEILFRKDVLSIRILVEIVYKASILQVNTLVVVYN